VSRELIGVWRSTGNEGGGFMPIYDLLVYHDFTDHLNTSPPPIGARAGDWFGDAFPDLHVVAVGPGIREGRVTVVLAHGERHMEAVQALLDGMAS